MESNFDHLLPIMQDILVNSFGDMLERYVFKNGGVEVNTSPLLNLTIGLFIGSLVEILTKIKQSTDGEERLFENIELTKKTLVKAIEDLPFITKLEFF